ncbi:MAG: hypothetical protein FJX46_08935 [Alphaproteobacteria bacterium]|nr:hypothetical protein [Alphaproteobacteria bacterium]
MGRSFGALGLVGGLALAASAASAQGGAHDAQIRQLLLGNAWCSFAYNQISGASRSERAQFAPDGSLTVTSGAESYSAGRGGTVAGQSQASRRYFWRVAQGDLHLSENGAQWQPTGLQAKRNSSGAIILVADGKEYAACR